VELGTPGQVPARPDLDQQARPWKSELAAPFALCEHGGVQIVIARDAGKVLARLQAPKARDIREAIDKVAADPAAPNNNIRPLTAVPDGFRIRVGDWRVSYTLDRRSGTMSVFEIAPRGGAYR
jgi:mRNA interferase RelE/StbE